MTLFSLILVLGVYYVTMPNELFVSNNGVVNVDLEETEEVSVEKEESDCVSSLKIELEKKREEEMRLLEEKLNDEISSDEMNDAYDKIKEIATYKGLEELISSKIDKNYDLESYVEVGNKNVSIVLSCDKHDVSFANEIMRLAQNEFKERVTVTVKFC